MGQWYYIHWRTNAGLIKQIDSPKNFSGVMVFSKIDNFNPKENPLHAAETGLPSFNGEKCDQTFSIDDFLHSVSSLQLPLGEILLVKPAKLCRYAVRIITKGWLKK
jgi:hypothetical protein